MLKISRSIESTIQPGESLVGVGGDSRAWQGRSKFNRSKLDGVEVDGSKIDGIEVEDDEVGKKVQKRSKSKNLSKTTSDFFIFGAKLTFTKLRQTFLKAPILYYFNPKCHIRIKKYVLGYAIDRILSPLISDDLGQ